MNKQSIIILLLTLLSWQLTTISLETTESCDLNDTCLNLTTTETPENTTEVAIELNLTTTAVTTITTTETALEIKEETLQQINQKGCFCDLQRYFCDISCCCDNDCTYENKLAFSQCKQEENRYVDTRFCDYMEYIYKNNTLYEWEVNQNGFFCIVRSNLPPQYTVQQKTEIKDLEDAELQTSNKYLWPEHETEKIQNNFNLSEKFVEGKTLWFVRNNNTLHTFSLPIAFITNMCGNNQEIKFLQNFKSKCAHYTLSEALKPETYYENVTLISLAWQLKNVSMPLDFQYCPKNICIAFNVNVCEEDFENCARKLPTKNKDALAEKIKYNIYHDGTKGIKKADLFIILQNSANFVEEFYQEFEVNFYWENVTLNYSAILSGNPGYREENPILTGNLLTLLNITSIVGTNLTETKKYHKIERKFNDITKNFMVFPINRNGFCKLNNISHVKVEFGFNTILKCNFIDVIDVLNKSAPVVCRNIQKYIFDRWSVIYKENSTKVVARFGNAKLENIGEWLKVLQNKQPLDILNSTTGELTTSNKTILCRRLVSKLSITIFHSRVDTKYYHNQEKIVGVLFKYGLGKNLEFPLQEGRLLFEIPTHIEVVFIDTTKRKIKKFVEPPTFKIRLPYDFFYPFIKIHNNANCIIIFDVLLCLLVTANCIISQ